MKNVRKVGIGFTLVELLIVIGIIAILALIAVPNFMNAQTRSKVSRAKSDMQTIKTAIGMYIIDRREPPFSMLYYQRALSMSEDRALWYPWNVLTTPIAYLTTNPIDPFREKGVKDGATERHGDQWRYYTYWSNSYALYDVLTDSDERRAVKLLIKDELDWILYSVGPQKTILTQPGPTAAFVQTMFHRITPNSPNATSDHLYDPTNGTTSHGVIWIDNKGSLN